MSNWKEEDDSLKAKFEFKDFKQAFSFMTAVAMHAEVMEHHPEWSNVYNEVQIKLTTHDAGNKVTEKDRKLAEKIDEVFTSYTAS